MGTPNLLGSPHTYRPKDHMATTRQFIKRFGFTWALESDTYVHHDQYGEVQFVSLEPGASGNSSYFIMHHELTGLWDLYEIGGAGPDVWDRVIPSLYTNVYTNGKYLSPMEAMHAAKMDLKRQMDEIEAWEREMDNCIEMERIEKAQKRGRIGWWIGL